MKRMMVQYTVKADRVAENERLVTEVFGELKRRSPEGLRYASYKLADGVSFVHLVSLETADGSNPLSELPAFKTFTAQIRDRCTLAPVVSELNEVGSYRFLDG